jgi:uncharacterized membrane protein
VKVEFFKMGRVHSHEFNRRRAQVVVNRDGSRRALRSHGRELEFGRHINDEQRLNAASARRAVR